MAYCPSVQEMVDDTREHWRHRMEDAKELQEALKKMRLTLMTSQVTPQLAEQLVWTNREVQQAHKTIQRAWKAARDFE